MSVQGNSTRLPKGQAREELIRATLRCIAKDGIENCTVRRVSDEAGVTNGLIRFYFKEKAELIRAAYEYYLGGILKIGDDRIQTLEFPPTQTLKAYLSTYLTAPIVTQESVLLWASFVPLAFRDAAMSEVRDAHYTQTRSRLHDLLKAAYREHAHDISADEIENRAALLFAFVDGLWIAGSMYPDDRAIGQLKELGLKGAERLLELPLSE